MAQELVENKMVFIAIFSRNIYGYWSLGDKKEYVDERNLCLMAQHDVECDEG